MTREVEELQTQTTQALAALNARYSDLLMRVTVLEQVLKEHGVNDRAAFRPDGEPGE